MTGDLIEQRQGPGRGDKGSMCPGEEDGGEMVCPRGKRSESLVKLRRERVGGGRGSISDFFYNLCCSVVFLARVEGSRNMR